MVFSTAENREQAERIAEKLVESRLVACVNIVPGIRSIYRWNDAVQKDDEVLMIMKTTQEKFHELEAMVRSLHTYDVPEVLSIAIHEGSEGYLKWLENSVSS